MAQEQRRVHINRISQTETNIVMLSSSEMRLGHGDRSAHVTNVTKILVLSVGGSQCMAGPGAGARLCDQPPSQSQTTPDTGSSNEVITGIIMWSE